MIGVYIACIFITVLLLIFFCCSAERHMPSIYLMMVVCIISNCGYLAISLADNVETALLANRFCYVIGVFLPMLIFWLICDICQIKIPRIALGAMLVIQIALMCIICTIGYSDIYYKSVELVKNSYGVSILKKEYGPLHVLYPISMAAYLIACVVVAFISLFRSTVVSYKNIYIFITCLVVSIAGYSLERAINLEVEIVPIVATLAILCCSISVFYVNTYFIKENIQKVQSATNNSCFISFDNKMNYLSSNDMAKQVFPELLTYKLDKPIPYSENLIYRKILPFLRDYAEAGSREPAVKQFEIGYLTYECCINPIMRETRKLGFLVELTDVTEKLKNLKMAQDYNRNLESEVLGKTQRIREIQDRTILGMAQMVESRDLSTGGHIRRTSSVVNIFARELKKSNYGLSDKFLYYVEKSAPMHDLGKIAVDDQVLRKPGKFTDEEYAKMKMHSSEGARVVREILTGVEDEEFMNIAVNVAHYHHEKVDGTGYPEGLKGDEIPVEARIMALADVFDALVSKRCYKDAFTYDKAFAIIEESAGSHFDAELAKIFIKCRPRLEALYHNFE